MTTFTVSGIATSDIIGGTGFDILQFSQEVDMRPVNISSIEKFSLPYSYGTIQINADQLLQLTPTLHIEGNSEGGNEIYVDMLSVQTLDLSGYTFTNWHIGSNNLAGYDWDRILVSGSANNDNIHGTTHNDVIYGGQGDDTLEGDDGHDHLHGGDGNDKLYAGFVTILQGDYLYGDAGDDILWSNGVNTGLLGGTGNDTFHVYTAADAVYEEGAGIDLIVSHMTGTRVLGSFVENLEIAAGVLGDGTGNTRSNTMTGNELANNFTGLDGNDKLYGNGDNDVLDGGAGADTLDGGTGQDTLSGGIGNDKIFGGDDADTISGFDGADIIHGDGGADVITGGAARDKMYAGVSVGAADTFVFTSIADSGITAGTRDQIYEFATGEDVIDVSAVDVSPGGSGVFDFIGNAAFSAAGQLRVRDISGGVLVEINNSGASGADFRIFVDGVTAASFAATDFIL